MTRRPLVILDESAQISAADFERVVPSSFAPDPAIAAVQEIASDIGIRDIESPLAVPPSALQVETPAERLQQRIAARRAQLEPLIDEMPGLAALAYGLSRIDGPVPAAVLRASEKRARRAIRNLQRKPAGWVPNDLAKSAGLITDPVEVAKTLGLPVVAPEDLRPVDSAPIPFPIARAVMLRRSVPAAPAKVEMWPADRRVKSVVTRVDVERGEIDIDTRLAGRQKKPRKERRLLKRLNRLTNREAG